MKRIWLLLIPFSVHGQFVINPYAGGGGSTNIVAASCSYTDVAAAVATSVDGDVVTIPAGTCTWTNTLVVTKAITLQGAGVGSTIIKDGHQVFGNEIMDWTLVSNKVSRLTAIEFQDDGASANGPRFRFSGTNLDARRIRIDNCYFNQLNGPVGIWYTCLGVFHSNVIVGKASGIPAFIGQVLDSSWGYAIDTPAWGDGSWVDDDLLGTANAMFFEDNIITNLFTTSLTALDGHSGTRYVFRYNTMDRGSLEVHGAEATRTRSGRTVEAYKNTFTGNDTRSTVGYFRGGVGVCWSNTISGWTASANWALLDNRSYNNDLFAPIYGADGRNLWDKNNAGNPFVTGTCSSAGSLTMTDNMMTWTVNQWAGYTLRRTSGTTATITRSGSTCTVSATSHGYTTGDYASIFGANEYGYNGTFQVTVVNPNSFTFTLSIGTPASPATGTILTCAKSSFALINSNTDTQITFKDALFGANLRCTFTAADTYEINKVDQAMDQIGVKQGGDLGGVDYPSIPGGWNDQTVSAWYEWDNTREAGADVDFSNAYSGGTFAVIQPGVNFINDTPKPGYTPYTYPHPLR